MSVYGFSISLHRNNCKTRNIRYITSPSLIHFINLVIKIVSFSSIFKSKEISFQKITEKYFIFLIINRIYHHFYATNEPSIFCAIFSFIKFPYLSIFCCFVFFTKYRHLFSSSSTNLLTRFRHAPFLPKCRHIKTTPKVLISKTFGVVSDVAVAQLDRAHAS